MASLVTHTILNLGTFLTFYLIPRNYNAITEFGYHESDKCGEIICMCADGDLVTIFDSSDLTYAIHCSKTLKLTLFGKYLNISKFTSGQLLVPEYVNFCVFVCAMRIQHCVIS